MNNYVIEQAAEYITELSKKTITPVTGWNIDNNTVNAFYESSELKKKADDHGTTELLKEMFFKYLSDNGLSEIDMPELYFNFKKNR